MRIAIFNPRRGGVTEEQLSAYIDGSLDAAARARIEDRLARSDELRSRLEALKATVAALRSAEPVRAPRSFALTPAMAYGEAKPIRGPALIRISPLMPAMAAAAAAVALGVLLVGNLTGSLRQSGQDTKEATGLSMPADGAIPVEGTMPAGAAMPAEVFTPAATVVVEKEFSRAAAVPVTPTDAATAATPAGAPALTLFDAAQATSGEESAPPMIAAELAQASPTPKAAPVAPAGPQSAAAPAGSPGPVGPAAPAVTPVETPIAAERAVADTEAEEAAPPASEVRQPGDDAESGLGLPLWQLEAALAAIAAVLGAAAIGVAVQRRRPSKLR